MRRRIITRHIYPPISDRRWDWCAYHDGDEELPHLYGWGSTKEEAVADLAQIDEEIVDEILTRRDAS